MSVDLRYGGQAFELVVPWPDAAADEAALARLVDAFHDQHRQRFSYSNPGDPVEIVTVRLAAIGRLPAVVEAPPSPASGTATERRRKLYLAGAWREVAVHRRDALTGPIAGPALIEEDYTTAFIGEGWSCEPALTGDLVARRTPPAGARA